MQEVEKLVVFLVVFLVEKLEFVDCMHKVVFLLEKLVENLKKYM